MSPNTILLGHEADATTPPAGEFVTRSFSIVSPTIAHPEALGSPLSILLRKTIHNATAVTEYDNIQIEAVKIPPELNANFDGLGAVSGLDLGIWKNHVGASSLDATHAHGNANGDDFVDGHDFLLWQRQVGTSATPIPEPLALTFAEAVAGALALRIRGRNSRGRSI